MRKNIVLLAEKPFSSYASRKISLECDKFEPHYRLHLIQGFKDRIKDVSEALQAVGDVYALIVRSDKVDEALLTLFGSTLKIIIRAGTGLDTIDLEACKRRGITVMNTPGQNSNAVSELVFGLLIQMMRRGFRGCVGLELKGKVLGLHGFGAVAKIVSRTAKYGFQMHVCAYDPYVDQSVFDNHGIIRLHSLDELYSVSNIVSIHAPLTEETKGIVNRRLLMSMQPNSIVINTARNEIVHEISLQTALEQHPTLSYCADVAPKSAKDLINDYGSRVFFTHIKCGAQTEEANMNCGLAAIRQIIVGVGGTQVPPYPPPSHGGTQVPPYPPPSHDAPRRGSPLQH